MPEICTRRDTAGAVKARQSVVPAWMEAFADETPVFVFEVRTPFGIFVTGMTATCAVHRHTYADDGREVCSECGAARALGTAEAFEPSDL